MNMLAGKRIVLGVTGGIAAYKAAELLRLLVKADAIVDVVLTEAGARFVGSATFQALSGNPVWTDLWDQRMPDGMAHIELTRRADAVLVAPASADFLAKLANGLADDLLSTLCLAREVPLIVAPAMNRQMWESAATRRNMARLAEDGVIIFGPAAGDQACGEVGFGRMLEAEELCEDLATQLHPRTLAGRRVLITAGPTFEALDPVRGITNSSSGRMGYALARAARDCGAEVTLVSGPVALAAPRGIRTIDVESALAMREAVLASTTECDIFIAVAAVADYRPARAAAQKMKKGKDVLSIVLEPNPDILAEVAALPKPPFCVGFAAESERLDEYAESKRRAKHLPLVVGNLVQDGLGGENNAVVLYDDSGRHPLPPGPKNHIAHEIIAHVLRLLGGSDDSIGQDGL